MPTFLLATLTARTAIFQVLFVSQSQKKAGFVEEENEVQISLGACPKSHGYRVQKLGFGSRFAWLLPHFIHIPAGFCSLCLEYEGVQKIPPAEGGEHGVGGSWEPR